MSVARIGNKWSDEEDKRLMNELRQGKRIHDIAKDHQRTERAIQMRLVKKMAESMSPEEIASCLHLEVSLVREWLSPKDEHSRGIPKLDVQELSDVLGRIDKRLTRIEEIVEKLYKKIKQQEKR